MRGVSTTIWAKYSPDPSADPSEVRRKVRSFSTTKLDQRNVPLGVAIPHIEWMEVLHGSCSIFKPLVSEAGFVHIHAMYFISE